MSQENPLESQDLEELANILKGVGERNGFSQEKLDTFKATMWHAGVHVVASKRKLGKEEFEYYHMWVARFFHIEEKEGVEKENFDL